MVRLVKSDPSHRRTQSKIINDPMSNQVTLATRIGDKYCIIQIVAMLKRGLTYANPSIGLAHYQFLLSSPGSLSSNNVYSNA